MNIEELKVVSKNITPSHLVDLVSVAVKQSFSSSDGEYHKYLQDYAETLVVLLAFTNYQADSEEVDKLYDEVMNIASSDKWMNEIIPEIGDVYYKFVEYVEDEIEQRTKPFANFNSAIRSAIKLMNDTNALVNAVDSEKLKSLDFNQLTKALNDLYTDEHSGTGDNKVVAFSNNPE